MQLLIQKVQALLKIRVMEEVLWDLRGKGFCFWYFLIPKAKGDLRPLLDLRNLNRLIKKLRVCMSLWP